MGKRTGERREQGMGARLQVRLGTGGFNFCWFARCFIVYCTPPGLERKYVDRDLDVFN